MPVGFLDDILKVSEKVLKYIENINTFLVLPTSVGNIYFYVVFYKIINEYEYIYKHKIK